MCDDIAQTTGMFFMDRILGACLSRCLQTFPNKELLRVTYE